MEEEKNVVEKTETTPEEITKENKEKETPEKTESTEETKDKSEVEDKSKESEVDFKAELEDAQNLLKQKDSIISHKEDVIKAEKAKNEPETADLEDEDKFAEFEQKQTEEMDAFKYGVMQDKIEEEIGNLAKSEDEAELIRFHIKNSVKFGYTMKEVKSAVKSAWLIANEKKILNTNAELANSLKAKSSMTTTANTSGQSIKEEPEEFSGEEKKLVDKFAKDGEKITASAPI